MFSNTFTTDFLSIFHSIGSKPLEIWDKNVKNGHIRRIIDDEVKSLVLEVAGTNVATTYITCPIKPRASLGIRLPFLVMVVKNMRKYFTFEIQILDDKNMRRRFRVSNFQSTTKVRPFCTTMPIGLSVGWNQIQFNLADFTRRAYGSVYIETVRVQIHANIRIRRIYFSSRLYSEEELPSEYKLFMPLRSTKEAEKDKGKKGKEKEEPEKEKRTSNVSKTSKIKEPEEPSGAPPTPITEVREAEEEVLEAVTEVTEYSEVQNVSEVTDKTDANAMEMPEDGPPAEMGEGAPPPPPEGEAPPAPEGEVPVEAPAEGPAEAPVEAPPADEPPPEQPPAEEAPADAPPAEDAPPPE